jgi:hypothetical protein
MKRAVVALALSACTSTAEPSGLYSSYFLSAIDGDLLPAPTKDLPAGSVVESGYLFFGRQGRPRAAANDRTGVVTYTRTVRDPNQQVETVSLELAYSISHGELRIDLCPPGALCLVPTELAGPVDASTLVLTHMLAGSPRSVYRFHAALPD